MFDINFIKQYIYRFAIQYLMNSFELNEIFFVLLLYINKPVICFIIKMSRQFQVSALFCAVLSVASHQHANYKQEIPKSNKEVATVEKIRKKMLI